MGGWYDIDGLELLLGTSDSCKLAYGEQSITRRPAVKNNFKLVCSRNHHTLAHRSYYEMRICMHSEVLVISGKTGCADCAVEHLYLQTISGEYYVIGLTDSHLKTGRAWLRKPRKPRCVALYVYKETEWAITIGLLRQDS